MAVTNCRHFTGYKPCHLNANCDEGCPSRSVPKQRILLIHLGALGAVVRSTTLLAAVKRKYGPTAHITWLTQKPADQLLRHNSQIDRVLTTEASDMLSLSGLQFDVCLTIDKSLQVGGIHRQVKANKFFGFQIDAQTGAIVPATEAANELWQIGLSDEVKFFKNKKPETQLVTEALELDYARDDYNLPLTSDEKNEAQNRRRTWANKNEVLVGINTGCSGAIPYKKLSVPKHRELIEQLRQSLPNIKIVLLGGREDQLRNQQISYGLNVIQSPTQSGLRDGLVSVDACDIIITGDSLGMHMAIARQKWVVAWFGPTCAHEIDLFDRGVKILSSATCAPCWKRSCHKDVMCYDLVESASLVEGVKKGISWSMLSSTPHLSVTSSCLYPCLDNSKNFIEKTI